MPKNYNIRSDADLRQIDAYMKQGKKMFQKKVIAKFMVDGTVDRSTQHLLCMVAKEFIVKEVSVLNTFNQPTHSYEFLRALLNNKNAKCIVLDFSGNAVDGQCIDILQKMIQENTVHKLSLSSLDDANVKDILNSVLARKSEMKSLVISNSTLNDECIIILEKILSTRKVKHSLCLSGCKPPKGSTVEQQKRKLESINKSTKITLWKSRTSFKWEAGKATGRAREEKEDRSLSSATSEQSLAPSAQESGYDSTFSLFRDCSPSDDFATPQLSRSVSTLKLSKVIHLPRRDKAGAVSKLPKKGHYGSLNFSPKVRHQWSKSLANIADEGHFLSHSQSILNIQRTEPLGDSSETRAQKLISSPSFLEYNEKAVEEVVKFSGQPRNTAKVSSSSSVGDESLKFNQHDSNSSNVDPGSKSLSNIADEDSPSPDSEQEHTSHSLHGQADIQQRPIPNENSLTATSDKRSSGIKTYQSAVGNLQNVQERDISATEAEAKKKPVRLSALQMESSVDPDTFETLPEREPDLPDPAKLFSNSATTETETDWIKSALTSQIVKFFGQPQKTAKVSSSSSVDDESSKFNQHDSNSSSVDPEPAKSHIPRFGRTGMVASRVRQYEVANYITYFRAHRKRFLSSNQAIDRSDLKSSSLNPFPVLKKNQGNIGNAAVSMLEIRKDDEKHQTKSPDLLTSESLVANEECKDEGPRRSVQDLKDFHEKEIEKQSSKENVAAFTVEKNDALKFPSNTERPKSIFMPVANKDAMVEEDQRNNAFENLIFHTIEILKKSSLGNSPSTSHGEDFVAQENSCTDLLTGHKTSHPTRNSSENADFVVLPQAAAGSFFSFLSESDDGNPISESFSVDIEPSGGDFMFYDCAIDIPSQCFTELTQLRGKLEIAPNKCPKGYIPITPMLYLESSNPPLKPITVRMTSWCINDGSEEGEDVKVDVLHLPTGSDDWEVIATLPFLDETKFKFDTPTEFSPFLVALRELFFGPQEFLIEGFLFSDRDDNFKFLFHLQHSLIDHVLGRRNYSNINDEKRICFDTLSVKANDTIRAEISSENLNFANAGASEFAVDEHFIRRQKWWRFETRILNNIPDTMELRCATFLNNTIKNRYSHTYSAKKGELQSIVAEVAATDNAVVVVEKNLGSGESAALILIVLSIFVLVVGILIKHFFSY